MYNGNTPYISPRYTREDYLNLNLTISSNNDDFEKAISIFIDRIRGRFFDQIIVLSNDWNKNGFAIMAFECLLIETFAQFRYGLEDTKNCSKKEYVKFLRQEFSCFTSKISAEKFYSYIRCGILHQAQTQKHSGLTYGREAINWSENFLMVSVDSFTDELFQYFKRYCNRLKDINETEVRENFVAKMKYICNRE